jgi:hypothetical protein
MDPPESQPRWLAPGDQPLRNVTLAPQPGGEARKRWRWVVRTENCHLDLSGTVQIQMAVYHEGVYKTITD